MSSNRRFARLIAALTLATSAPIATHASDGVIEINQTCAEQTGCLPGDGPGFPVSIASEGSYRLTGPLRAGGAAPVDAIVIQAANVSLDLGGFAISCMTDSQSLCSHARGAATGILVSGANGVHISNGIVRDFSDDGIQITNTDGYRLDGLHLMGNFGDGVAASDANGGQIKDCLAVDNTAWGFDFPTNSGIANMILDTTTYSNGSGGLNAPVTVTPIFWLGTAQFFDGLAGFPGALDCYSFGASRTCPP